MKKILRMSAVLLIGSSLTIIMSSCAGDRYTESTGEQIDDTATTGRVKDALHHDTVYKYPGVKVSTFKGTVQLSGFVNQSAQKDRAETLAKDAPGAKMVVNNITVKE